LSGGVTSTVWDPGQYLRFAVERERPFHDLVGRVSVAGARRVVDLGCGPATTTVTLLERWPGATVIGVDSSPEMIEAARRYHQPGRLELVVADVAGWSPPGPVDVVVANAVFQWVPGHEAVIARMARHLAPGGALAFQIPANFDQPVHTELRRLARSGRWSLPADLLRDRPVREPGEYLSLLLGLGLAAEVWETTYLHVLEGPDPVLTWARGTALRPVLGALDPQAVSSFEAAYREALAAAHPPDEAGRTVLPFRRIFAVAHAGGGEGGDRGAPGS